MHTGTLKKMALALTFWLALRFTPLHAQTAITGDYIGGDTLYLGSWSSNPGWQMEYTDGTLSYIDFVANRSTNEWSWYQSGGGTPLLQMSLSSASALTLYNSSGTAEITLSPTGTSSFANSLTVSGTDNEMPNQTLVNGNSVLTESLADSRYASSSSVSPLTSNITIGSGTVWWGTAPNMSLNGGTATAGYSFAEGGGSTASGERSTAMGMGSTASGYGSMVMGYNSTASGLYSTASGYRATASGYYSTAMGRQPTASGDYSTAMGQFTTASGIGSTAMGCRATASGRYSTASGYRATASDYYSTAMGYHSTASAYASTASGAYTTASGGMSTAMGLGSTALGWISTASGFYSTASGTCSMTMGHDTTASGYGSTAMGIATTAQAFAELALGQYNVGGFATGGDTTWIATDPLLELGNGTSSAPSDALVVYKNGSAAFQGPVTVAPGGDIPMYTGE